MDLVDFFMGVPEWLMYVVLGTGAALENVFPPLPADSFVVIGSFLAGRGAASVATVFLVTWAANVAAAAAVYVAGRRYGIGFFRTRLGRRLLNERQLGRLQGFYDRWGVRAIFLTRFIPGVRAVIPVFAGVSKQTAPRVLLPLAIASGIWHAVLVLAGAQTGRNLEAILETLAQVNIVLVVLGVVLGVGAIAAWWITRHEPGEPDD